MKTGQKHRVEKTKVRERGQRGPSGWQAQDWGILEAGKHNKGAPSMDGGHTEWEIPGQCPKLTVLSNLESRPAPGTQRELEAEPQLPLRF